jgi:hypothetical protein
MTGSPEEEAAEVVGHERDRQAAALRIAGLTYQQIADRLGYAGASGAYKAAERALFGEQVSETVDNLRQLEGARLDDLLVGLWVAARAGNVGAIDRVLKIMERRARLFGLDQGIEAPAAATGGAKVSSLDKARRKYARVADAAS